MRDLYRAVKSADPDTGRISSGYSSATSVRLPTGAPGCVDFESLVADGLIDGWIEQTWAGRGRTGWHQLWKGRTFQTANPPTRGAMMARANEQRTTPCRFYNLIETWDGWEPWDTPHQVPAAPALGDVGVLARGCACPGGVTPPDGSYVSWVNNGAMDILSPEDVEARRQRVIEHGAGERRPAGESLRLDAGLQPRPQRVVQRRASRLECLRMDRRSRRRC
ncbi:MAG: hypothetical protein U0521_02675 [Anaerolineae bacterium]